MELTLNFELNTFDINSFVVVLPLLPVKAINLVFVSLDLWILAISCKDSRQFLTVKNNGWFSDVSSTTAYDAPFFIASSANLFPSKLSPLRAK